MSEAARRERPLFCAGTKTGRPTGAAPSDKAVVCLVKGAAQRAGLATAAGALPDPMRQTRHTSTQVALTYLRPADLWRNNVTETAFGTTRRCCMGRLGGRVDPNPRLRSGDADGVRAPELQHAVEDGVGALDRSRGGRLLFAFWF